MKKKNLKFRCSFFYFSGNLGMSFSFFFARRLSGYIATVPLSYSHNVLIRGILSVVWQQQKEKAYHQRLFNKQMVHKTFPTSKNDYIVDFDTNFRISQKSLLMTHISFTLNLDLTPIGMKTSTIKIKWSTNTLTINLIFNLKIVI